MGPVSYVHTKRFVHELQAFTRDFGLLRRVIMQARLKVCYVRKITLVLSEPDKVSRKVYEDIPSFEDQVKIVRKTSPLLDGSSEY